MGGLGSGNRLRWSSRDTCESSLRIDLRYMRARGFLQAGSSGVLSWSRGGEPSGFIRYRSHRKFLEVDYRVRSQGVDWTPVREFIPLVYVDQPFGGTRAYMRCLSCGNRCAVLYGGARFRCRKCSNLAYSSQNGDASDRALTISQKIRTRLGGGGCFDDPIPPKPKGMHWKTCRRLQAKCEFYEDQIADQFVNMIARFGGQI